MLSIRLNVVISRDGFDDFRDVALNIINVTISAHKKIKNESGSDIWTETPVKAMSISQCVAHVVSGSPLKDSSMDVDEATNGAVLDKIKAVVVGMNVLRLTPPTATVNGSTVKLGLWVS